MPTDFNTVTLIGTIRGGEQWTCTAAYQTSFGTGPVKDFDDLQAWATAVAALSGSDYLALLKALSAGASLTRIRVAYIDSAGVTAQVAEAPMTGGWVSSDAVLLPYQCAVVCSLLSGRPGRSYRGRIYWPALGVTIDDTTIKLATSEAQGIADDAAALLTDIGGLAGPDALMVPAVASTRLGITSFVSSIRVGNVVDTQRRRRNSAVETYVSSAVPPAA